MSSSNYDFKTIENSNHIAGTGKLLNPPWPDNKDDYGKQSAAFRGSLLRLFGQPIEKSTLADEAYLYVIEAVDDKGNNWILSAYEGPSGPAIGGDILNNSILSVAESLLQLIEKTIPTDFEEIIYYQDSHTTVTYGCKDGDCYWLEMPGNHLDQK